MLKIHLFGNTKLYKSLRRKFVIMKKEKLWTKDYILIILMSTFQNAQMQLVNPIMSKYNKSIGIDINIIGIIIGVFSLAALIIRPVSGPLADRFNNKLIASISAVMMGVSTLGYIISGESIPLIFFFRLLHGISFGICGTTLMRMASYLIAPSRMGEGMGYFGLGQVVSIALAPSIGIYLSETFGYYSSFITSAAVVVGVGIMALFLKLPDSMKIKEKREQKRKFSFSNIIAKEALLLAAIACTISFANSLETAYIVLYGESLGLSNIGLYFTVSAATMFIVRLFAGKLMDKHGLAFVMIPSLTCVGGAMVLLGISGITAVSVGVTATFTLFMIASILKSFGQGTAQPAIQTSCLQSVPMEKRGVASSTYFMGCDIGQGVGPIVGGVIAGSFGYPGIYFCAAIIIASGIALFLLSKKSKKAVT